MIPIDTQPINMDMIVPTQGGFSFKTHKITKKYQKASFIGAGFSLSPFQKLLFEKILAFTACSSSKIDGMPRAMVIAGKTSGAQAVMKPLRVLVSRHTDIADRTDLATLAATDTAAGIDGKFGIGYPVIEEKATKQLTVNARPAAFVDKVKAMGAPYYGR